MCSETVAHKKPLVYVSRPLFAEEFGLINNLMIPHGHCLEMPQADFYSGKWSSYIEQASKCNFDCVLPIELDGDLAGCLLLEKITDEFHGTCYSRRSSANESASGSRSSVFNKSKSVPDLNENGSRFSLVNRLGKDINRTGSLNDIHAYDKGAINGKLF